ncbi:hypothetical protein [Brevibacillus panacihumi]|uniref:Uncharacterized protein n=1 Tax=Brevibacillus panacihumi TaxID=497735 RepID=A0A3M8C8W8_9BACL|nr:hypothetical protein [Brevibacillus panacihumi]RNB72160.1 hypothetical protein EDM58_21895 [Brevibacillus panacihumi]
MQAQSLKIDLESNTVIIPVGSGPLMVLIDPKRKAANLVPLVEHGDIVVKCYQGRITGYDERKSHRFE